MTSYANVTNVRPGVILDCAATPAPDVLAASRDTEYVVDCPESYGLGQDVGEDFWMYLQLRATSGTVNKCLTHLDRQLQFHPGADVEIVGIGTDQHTVRVIIGVNLGDSFRIKTRPKNVLAAYEFVQSLSADLANFWPQYLTGTPTDDERDLLASVVAAGAIQTRSGQATMVGLRAAAEVLAFEPVRELVSAVQAGHSDSWQIETAVA
jgi:hypothetical protein